MRVLDIYSEKDLDILKYKDVSISKLMDNFFMRFPKEYRENYDKNLRKLEILRVDKLHERNSGGEFFPNCMQLFYKDSLSYLIHELLHMASYDDENQKFAISRNLDFSIYEGAFVEGITEYLASIARNSSPNGYRYQVFVISMLDQIDGFFEPYFIPSYDNFIDLFPNKKDIISLMYALEFYYDKFNASEYDKWELVNMKQAIMDIIDGLIDIELSFDKTEWERKLYGDKFMSLISDADLNGDISCFYKQYREYAYDKVKKRILGR